MNPVLNQINGQNGERQSQILVTTKHDIESRFDVEKLSCCCRYRKPAVVSLFSVGLILVITFLVLYWNYYETVHRRMTKKKVWQNIVASFKTRKPKRKKWVISRACRSSGQQLKII